MQESCCRGWFGSVFATLHPLLQRLHSDGGTLTGPATLRFGPGLAGWFGRRLARRLRLPADDQPHTLRVDINPVGHQLEWTRRFDDAAPVRSLFVPVGQWPDGHWLEHTGRLRLALAVDVIDGGWHWRCLKIWLGPLRLPRGLLPQTTAYKCIEDGRYRFFVGFSVPLLGEVVSYSGLLTAAPSPLAAKPLI